MTKIRLFRGVAVEDANRKVAESNIRFGNLQGGAADWRFWFRRHPRPLDVGKKPGFNRSDTRIKDLEKDGPPASFACGDPEGASHYAWRGKGNSATMVPLLIEFEADVEQIAIDGRDSLYSLFPKASTDAGVRRIVETLWGEAISPYLDLAEKKPNDSDYLFALVDLACTDKAVVEAHYSNRRPIEGRYGTKFCSAFLVPREVLASAIVDIRVVERRPTFDEGAGVINVYRLPTDDKASKHS